MWNSSTIFCGLISCLRLIFSVAQSSIAILNLRDMPAKKGTKVTTVTTTTTTTTTRKKTKSTSRNGQIMKTGEKRKPIQHPGRKTVKKRKTSGKRWKLGHTQYSSRLQKYFSYLKKSSDTGGSSKLVIVVKMSWTWIKLFLSFHF